MYMMSNLKPAATKVISEPLLQEYLDLAGVIRDLEKQKEEIRKSILFAYPQGGAIGDYLVFIETQNRRSFPFDNVKAQVSPQTWKTLYEPFIKVSPSQKVVVKKI